MSEGSGGRHKFWSTSRSQDIAKGFAGLNDKKTQSRIVVIDPKELPPGIDRLSVPGQGRNAEQEVTFDTRVDPIGIVGVLMFEDLFTAPKWINNPHYKGTVQAIKHDSYNTYRFYLASQWLYLVLF